MFRERTDAAMLRGVLDAFEDGEVVDAGDDVASADYAALAEAMPGLGPRWSASPTATSRRRHGRAVEFLLEGLHLCKRLNKENVGTRSSVPGAAG